MRVSLRKGKKARKIETWLSGRLQLQLQLQTPFSDHKPAKKSLENNII